MTPAAIIEDVLAAGGEIWTEGDRLKFRDTPARLIPLIREHKAALLALLSSPAPDDYPREERAAIMEYDGGLPREKAERLAGLAPPPLTITRRDPNARFRETPQPAPATVTCGTCAEFEPGTPAWGRGVGRCSRTANGLPPVASRGYGACFPDAPRTCPDYKEL